MAVRFKQHIKMLNDNPLNALMDGRSLKAYIVAEIAQVDGVEATATLYELDLGAVYAAMSFYEDNREAIEQALEEVRAIDLGDMEVDAQEAIAKFKKRMNEK